MGCLSKSLRLIRRNCWEIAVLDALASYTVVKLTFRVKTQHGNICLCFDSKIITFALNKVNIITFPVTRTSFPTSFQSIEDFFELL